MIRKFETKDLSEVMELWLSTNIQAHDFISKDYWVGNFDMVKNILPEAEIYVYELDDKIKAFVGIDTGIFVSSEMQSKGIGKQLLKKAKELYSELRLAVYQKNTKAVSFYQREQFIIRQEQIDENTREKEYLMVWNS